VTLRRLVVFFILACSLQAVAAGAASSALQLHGEVRIRLLDSADAAIARSDAVTVDEMARSAAWGKRIALPTGNDWQQTPVWYRFRLERTDATTYAITWPGIVGRVDLYCETNGNFSHQSGGYDASSKSLTDHILILPENVYGRTCYLRALTGYYLSSPSIVPLERALKLQFSMAPTFGGFFIAIVLFNLLMFVMLRQPPLLIYAAAILTALLVMVTDDTAWRYIPSTPFGREFVHELFGWLYFAVTAYFARVFLDLPRYDPRMATAILVLVAASALELVAGVLPARPYWIDVVTLVLLIALLVTLVVAGVRSALRGYRGARFFVVGSAGVCIGITANILTETFALHVPNFVLDLYAIGVAWEALWLTAALAERMSEVARENVTLRVAHERLQQLAEIDPLTGVPNRRSFEEHLQTEWNRAQRTGTPLGVIMIDVDRFKDYNDHLGHVAGDECLWKIAQACASSLKRSGDFFGRYGGEEFAAILLTDSDGDIAIIAERMRSAVVQLGMPHPTSLDGIVTISLGVARVRPTPRQKAVDLVDAADHALYAAKSAGRNQVGLGAYAL